MSIPRYYEALIKRSADVLIATERDADCLSALLKSHNFIADYELLAKAIEDRPKPS
jgi:hypothetical protein